MSYPVVIVDYDLEWPVQYAAEADRIREAYTDAKMAFIVAAVERAREER